MCELKIKNLMKNSKKLLNILCHQKIHFFTMQKMKSFSIKTWSKIGVEIIKHNGKKWINEKYLEIALGYKNLVNKTQYYSDELKKKKI